MFLFLNKKIFCSRFQKISLIQKRSTPNGEESKAIHKKSYINSNDIERLKSAYTPTPVPTKKSIQIFDFNEVNLAFPQTNNNLLKEFLEYESIVIEADLDIFRQFWKSNGPIKLHMQRIKHMLRSDYLNVPLNFGLRKAFVFSNELMFAIARQKVVTFVGSRFYRFLLLTEDALLMDGHQSH